MCITQHTYIKSYEEVNTFSFKQNMSLLHFLLLLKLQIILICATLSNSSITELDTLLAIKDSLDPENRVLISWTPHSDPCSGANFEGVACNEQGLVTNISLQGKGLSGRIPSAMAGLKNLTGLYLHFNALNGILPKEIASLTQLSDLYLNVNNLSGEIPREVGNMSNLQGGLLIFLVNLWFLFFSLLPCVIFNHIYHEKIFFEPDMTSMNHV